MQRKYKGSVSVFWQSTQGIQRNSLDFEQNTKVIQRELMFLSKYKAKQRKTKGLEQNTKENAKEKLGVFSKIQRGCKGKYNILAQYKGKQRTLRFWSKLQRKLQRKS